MCGQIYVFPVRLILGVEKSIQHVVNSVLSSVHLYLLGRGNSLGSGFGFTVVDNDFFRNRVIWL